MRTFLVPELEKAELQSFPMLSSLSLKGNQDKWYDKSEKLVVKAALFDGFVWWEDWKVEVIATWLLPQFGIKVVEQWPCLIDDGHGNTAFGSYSRDYRKDRERYVPFGQLLRSANLEERFPAMSAIQKIDVVTRVLSAHLGEKQAEQFVEDMCLADYLMGNVDRHYENYGILIRRDEANKVIAKRPVPLYDFGMGLFQNQKEGKGNDLAEAMQNMIHSPFAINLEVAYSYYREAWCRRCRGMVVNLAGVDFPAGLGKLYLAHALASLSVKLEV